MQVTLAPTPPSHHQSCQQVDWKQRANSISTWISSISASGESPGFFVDDLVPALEEAISNRSRRRERETQRRSRTCSPNGKSSEYRNTVLKPTNILVDVVHTLPPEIEALLPSGLRDLLDPPHGLPSSVSSIVENTETTSPRKEFDDIVSQLAAMYRDECRELARKPGSEFEYRAHLYSDVVEKLARVLPGHDTLRAICSDESWLASLKPPALAPIHTLPWLAPSSKNPQDSAQVLTTPNTTESSNVASPLTYAEPTASSLSTLKGTIITPNPDITIGLSREAFSSDHARLLNHWQATNTVLSDPNTTQGTMRYPFLTIHTKAPSTHTNLLAAQNHAAGTGTCALRLLASLAAQDPNPATKTPRIVFSCTTEGAIHELWIHFQAAQQDQGTEPKYHMACLGAWRTTLHRHAHDFVHAIALILAWGAHTFLPAD